MPSRAYGWRHGGMLEPTEAAVLRQVVADVLAGKSLRAVVTDLNTRGVPTATGRQWAITPLKRLLLHPRMIGMQQDSKGRVSKWRDDNRVPMLERPVWDRLRVVLAPNPDRAASMRKRGPGEAWLTGVAVCGQCGGPLSSKVQGTRPRGYACREPGPGHVRISATGEDGLEDHVRAAMLDRCAEHGDVLGERVGFWSSRAGVEKRIRDATVAEAALGRQFAEGSITERALQAGVVAAQELREVLQHDLEHMTDGGFVGPVTVVDAAAHWAALPHRGRRGLARLLIDRVVVRRPDNPTGHRFEVVWVEPFPTEDVARSWAGIPAAGKVPQVA